MGLARTRSVTLVGVHGIPVEVEADLAAGLPGFTLVGLPDEALSESRDRVRAAVTNSGESWPQRRITASLCPASVPKRGSGFDLPLACVVLAAAGALPPDALAGLVILGELGLDGRVRPVRGVLPAVLAAAAAGSSRIVVPAGNAAEAALVPDMEVIAARSLRQVLALLRGEPEPVDVALPEEVSSDPGAAPFGAPPDLADVRGQFVARRALEVCAAGGHHLLLHGAPGGGKTMLAERLPGLLPPLEHARALEVTAIHSVAGTLPSPSPLITIPPFQAPHHTATVVAMVGGGSGVIRPGAVSLAHGGVLFLDEAPQFPAIALDALRQPLESGEVVISRSCGVVSFPARFLLVLAANPCPCGLSGGKGSACQCSATARRRYWARLSGPLLDRVDVRVAMPPVSRVELLSEISRSETSGVVAARIRQARERARQRFTGTPWRCNAEVPGRQLRSCWRPAAGALTLMETALERGLLTARGLDRVLRVAWTLADLAGHGQPVKDDVSAALYYRTEIGQGALE